ncbi:hypothetical protein MA16_Dca017556 [Dendrobium catenatum]|uniref:Uncharacterized protein n=1 Tax=Dendrobium catenatum TaxID=906689 RepID=A0A2I0WKF7_9ASPA|nr:hypothetical protein MA16_Dca017556 [Dendrobium catenatum]
MYPHSRSSALSPPLLSSRRRPLRHTAAFRDLPCGHRFTFPRGLSRAYALWVYHLHAWLHPDALGYRLRYRVILIGHRFEPIWNWQGDPLSPPNPHLRGGR